MDIATITVLILVAMMVAAEIIWPQRAAVTTAVRREHGCGSRGPEAAAVVLLIGLMVFGRLGFEIPWMMRLNELLRREMLDVRSQIPPFDDFVQYLPVLAMYLLGRFGYRGEHPLRQEVILLVIAALLLTLGVNVAKYSFEIMRPDGTSANSFPSGHTATAFMAAELLRREYAWRSRWIGVGGYAIAVSTGVLRICHVRHWLNDVIAGAALGVLCVTAAYLIFNHFAAAKSRPKSQP